MNKKRVTVGAAYRDLRRPKRVVNVYSVDGRYAHIVNERSPHHKNPILCAALLDRFERIGAITDFDNAPDFFKRAVESRQR